jgi:DNA invertase Pin-like site-specific DNA recombinase
MSAISVTMAAPLLTGGHHSGPVGAMSSFAATGRTRALSRSIRLDRLARSTRDLLNILARIIDKGAGFRSLADAWADTTTAHGRLMLTVLGGMAEFERELIRVRTHEGRARAKAQGVRLGRPPKLSPCERRQALERRAAGESQSVIARSYHVSCSTISRLRLA